MVHFTVLIIINLLYSRPFQFTGVPSQPSNFRAIDIYETSVTLAWSKPALSSENIVHYELYWNDTYANVQHHK